MDSIFVVILLFALYVVPEILRRRRKPTTYKYPEFPTSEPEQQDPGRVIGESRLSPVKTAVALSPALQTGAAMPLMTAMPVSEPTEQVNFDNLAYGMVMAEILGPPKALAVRGRFTQRRR